MDIKNTLIQCGHLKRPFSFWSLWCKGWIKVVFLGCFRIQISDLQIKRNSKNGFCFTGIFLRGGFHLRNPNLAFMGLPIFCSFWKSEKGFPKWFSWTAVHDAPTVSEKSIMADQWLETAFDCEIEIKLTIRQSQTKIRKLTGRGSRFKYVEFRHFALLFFRRRQNNVPRIIIMHVQSYFVARLTFSCWAKVDCLRSLLKFPIRFLAQNWKIINRCSQNHLIFANPFSDFQNEQKICKSIKSKFGFLKWNPSRRKISMKQNLFSDFMFYMQIRNPDFKIQIRISKSNTP